jgi:hypothetical protein
MSETPTKPEHGAEEARLEATGESNVREKVSTNTNLLQYVPQEDIRVRVSKPLVRYLCKQPWWRIRD